MTDFSQSGEQTMILTWANRHGPGRWLDIGAADGVSASNTHALAQAGWAGVAVEPGAVQFDHLAHLYHDRPDIETVQAALVASVPNNGPCDDTPRLTRFHYSHDLVSTTQPENAKVWAELATFVPVYVAAVTVPDLLELLPGPYDFVSVDTEGTTLELTEELLQHGALAPGGLLCVECENGEERWLAQRWCLDGFARVGVTPNNLLLEKLPPR